MNVLCDRLFVSKEVPIVVTVNYLCVATRGFGEKFFVGRRRWAGLIGENVW